MNPTVDSLTLCEVAVVLTSQETVSISPHNTFNVAVFNVSYKYFNTYSIELPVIHVEQKPFHLSLTVDSRSWAKVVIGSLEDDMYDNHVIA